MPESRFFAERAWLDAARGVANGVLIAVEGDRIVSVGTDVTDVPADATRLAGLTLPGLVNAHSHAFHRALRSRSEIGSGDFWSWRDLMYSVAGRLDPDSYLTLATAAYAEMALAGITTVGEFHYLHHDRGGSPYPEPNAMGEALLEAARRAGIRMTLIDTCYLQGGADGRSLVGPQLRFGDGGGENWARRVDGLLPIVMRAGSNVRAGVAIHSVRAVPPPALATVATYASRHDIPLHFHLSEQQRENEECLVAHGRTPASLLDQAGALTSHSTAVHATHLQPHDITLLGRPGTAVCACPTTERDLADGIGPFADLLDAGSPLCIGSDSHAVIDPFEEMRGIELHERLAGGRRGVHSPRSLLEAGTSGGAGSLGWPDAGRIDEGYLADLVTISLDSPRLAGWAGASGTARTATGAGGGGADETGGEGALLEAAAVFAAGAADVRHVAVGGAVVVSEGRHVRVPDVAAALAEAIAAVTGPDR